MSLRQYIGQQNEQQMFGVACVGDDFWCSSACLELDQTAQIISYEEYHPFGTTSYRSGRTETEVSLKRYKYVGKERDEETGLYYYGARYYAAWICRFVSVDPFAKKYQSISPYCYVANMPIIAIDPDGRKIKIIVHGGGWDSKAFIEVAATIQGKKKLRSLINAPSIYIAKEVKNYEKSAYDDKANTIKYGYRNYPSISHQDIISWSGAVIFGHESVHALDDLENKLYYKWGGKTILDRAGTERRAGDFGNYLRSVYSMSFYRDYYFHNGKIIVKYNTTESYVNPSNEKITDMKLLGSSTWQSTDNYGSGIIKSPSFNLNKNKMVGVSYDQSITGDNGESKTITMYMLTWMNSSGEVDFFKTSDKADYDKKVKSMEGIYSFSTENTFFPGIY